MVDVSEKPATSREARASALVRVSPGTVDLLAEGNLSKGDAFAVARVAGIMAAKKTSDLIPLCHPLAITQVEVEFETSKDGVLVKAKVKTTDRTGVEMEAMVAASVAALALYDMIKGVDREAVIEQVALQEKSGGKSGEWRRS